MALTMKAWMKSGLVLGLIGGLLAGCTGGNGSEQAEGEGNRGTSRQRSMIGARSQAAWVRSKIICGPSGLTRMARLM